MSNVAKVLKAEIGRISKREAKSATQGIPADISRNFTITCSSLASLGENKEFEPIYLRGTAQHRIGLIEIRLRTE